MINKEISIEELVENYPFAVRFLAEKGIRCIACGEPIWGTLEEACIEKGFSVEAIEAVIRHLYNISLIHGNKDFFAR